MTTSDGGSDDAAEPVAVEPVAEPEPVAAAAEAGFVVVSRDEVDDHLTQGYTVGYALLKPS